MFPNVTLILGGASSGKSNFAEALAKSCDKSAVYVATAQPHDSEMTDRIKRHKRSRGSGWHTVEAPLDVAGALADRMENQIVLLDCATLWLSNHMAANSDLPSEVDRLLTALKICAAPVVIVSNEVGSGGVSPNKLARTFAQEQGQLNIAMAGLADLAVQVTAGLPMVLKGRLPT